MMLVNPYVFAAAALFTEPTLIGFTTADRNNTSFSLPVDVPYPVGIETDMVAFAHISTRSGAGTDHVINTPAGWVKISEQGINGFVFMRHAVFSKVLDGSESGTVAFGTTPQLVGTGSALIIGAMSLWGGVDTATLTEGLAVNIGTSANMTGSAVTTAGVDRRVLNFGNAEMTTSATPAFGWTEDYDYNSTESVDSMLSLHSLAAPTAGTVAAVTHTLSASRRWGVISVALRPA